MTAPRRVNYNGASLTLRQLAAATGQTYACLYGRYRKGDREPELWRPLECVGGNKAGSRSSFRGEGASALTREAEATKREAKSQRERDRAVRIAELKALHAAAFARPLIDSKLLTKAERAAIRERVKFSGQVNWRTNGASY